MFLFLPVVLLAWENRAALHAVDVAVQRIQTENTGRSSAA
jgi:hypothetical protein